MKARGGELARLLVALMLSILASGCIYRTWHTPAEVRGAIGESRVLGRSPAQVVSLLRRVRLKRGDTIQVAFYPDIRQIQASVSHARRTLWVLWDIDVTVTFDSTLKATGLDVEYDAVNPL